MATKAQTESEQQRRATALDKAALVYSTTDFDDSVEDAGLVVLDLAVRFLAFIADGTVTPALGAEGDTPAEPAA